MAPAQDDEQFDACPTCRNETHVGFGLAGGGYGAYVYCEDCGIISKTQEDLSDGLPHLNRNE